MKFEGIFLVVIGVVLLLSTLGLFKASINVIMILLAILLIISGFDTFLKANKAKDR